MTRKSNITRRAVSKLAAVAPLVSSAMAQNQPRPRRPALVSPEIGPDNRVTFRYLAPDASDVVLAGLSMGGSQALYAGLRHVDLFAWVASFSGAFVIWPGAMTAIPPESGPPGVGAGWGLNLKAVAETFPDLTADTAARLKLFYISCGTDDGLIVSGRQFTGWLKSRGIRFVDVETPGYAHVWSYWRKSLVDLAPRLFH